MIASLELVLLALYTSLGLSLSSITFEGNHTPFEAETMAALAPAAGQAVCLLTLHFGSTNGVATALRDKMWQGTTTRNFLDVPLALKTRRILQLKDITFMSDEHYSIWRKFMGTGLLLPLYVIINLRKSVNTLIEIYAPEGVTLQVCATMGFETTLRTILETPKWRARFQQKIDRHKKMLTGTAVDKGKLKLWVRVGGDGRQTTRAFNSGMLCFKIMYGDDYTSSVMDEIVICVWKGGESREVVEPLLKNIYKEIATVQKNGMKVWGLDCEVGVGHLCDRKFLATVLGLSEATSDNACVCCEASKSQWQDLTMGTMEFDAMKRTLQKQAAALLQPSRAEQLGYKDSNLLDINPCDALIDVLHLMMRTFEVLFASTIYISLQILSPADKQIFFTYLTQLVVEDCKVSGFNIYKPDKASSELAHILLLSCSIFQIPF